MSNELLPNCVGYVAHRMGLEQTEKYILPPTLKEIMTRYNEVPDIGLAQAIAIIRPDGGVCHMVVVESDGSISHRKNYGHPVTEHEPIDIGLSDFLERLNYFTFVYLTLKTE